jgi:hypothetical protein
MTLWIWLIVWAVLATAGLMFMRGAHVDDPFGDA